MRTMGDLNWLNDYVGLPYKFGGRDWTGLDCYGLAGLVYKEEYGIDLPDWLIDEVDLRDRAQKIEDQVCSGTWTETDDPQDGDFVICYRTRAAHHLGLYFGGGVLHAADGIGVVYEPVGRFAEKYLKVVFGSWNP